MVSSEHLLYLEPSHKLDTKAAVCVVGKETAVTNPLKRALKVTGFHNVFVINGFENLTTRSRVDDANVVFVHLDGSEGEVRHYLEECSHLESAPPTILVTDRMDVDNLFSFLALGTKAFLILPFSVSSMEEVVSFAQHAPPLDKELLSFENRNKAFSHCILNNLEKTSRALRKRVDQIISDKEYSVYSGAFRHSARLAKSFRRGSDEDLRDEIVRTIISRAKRLDTRLQRTRRRLQKEREEDSD